MCQTFDTNHEKTKNERGGKKRKQRWGERYKKRQRALQIAVSTIQVSFYQKYHVVIYTVLLS